MFNKPHCATRCDVDNRVFRIGVHGPCDEVMEGYGMIRVITKAEVRYGTREDSLMELEVISA
jgi:hypothetical protein